MQLKSRQRRLVLTAATMAAGAPLLAYGAAARELRIVTSHLPPLSVEHDTQAPGALHEVVSELCRRVGLAPAMQFVPWRRAVFLAANSRATTIFPLTRTAERERQYRWLAPVYDENYVFLAPRGRAFDVHQPAIMKDMRVTLLRGAALKAVLVEMGYKNIIEARSIDEVHRFMVAGIADAAFGELNIVRTALRTRGAQADFDYSAPVRKTSAWLAGSLDFTEAQAASFQRALKEMKADGAYFAIVKRYQLG